MSAIPEAEILAAAAAIANARGGRRGLPPSDRKLEYLQKFNGGRFYREIIEDATAALEAAATVRAGGAS